MERHLAAVLIADVVGYSRLSEIDEEGTRARFQADLNDTFEPKIVEHHGRLVKTMGDGILAEFHSVVDALRCAVQIQLRKAKENDAAPPNQRLDFRIGVNLGDIIVEADDIHGDGVNVANRIQALAEPGGVAISGTAYDQVRTKVAVGFASLGEQKVKNIAEPIRVYQVLLDPAAAGKTTEASKPRRSWRAPAAVAAVIALLLVGATAWWQPWRIASEQPSVRNVVTADTRPSLVVLPFDNLGSDAEQGYLADGITEDLTTELARVPGLFVISRNAAFTYKNKSLQPAQIATELKVRYLLEGSIRRVGDDMRINAQLIDATTNGHIWAERFDGAWNEVFELQDKMVSNIGTALKLRLIEGQLAAKIAGGTSNSAAYEAYLRGRELELREKPEDWVEADKALRAGIGSRSEVRKRVRGTRLDLSGSTVERGTVEALGLSIDEARNKARCIFHSGREESLSDVLQNSSLRRLNMQQRSDEAIAAAERAIALDASDPANYESLSIAMIYNGRAMDGLGYLDAASRVDPLWTRWRYLLAGSSLFLLERYEGSCRNVGEDRAGGEGDYILGFLVQLRRPHACSFPAYAQLGQSADAAKARERLKPYLAIAQDPEYTGLMAAGSNPRSSITPISNGC